MSKAYPWLLTVSLCLSGVLYWMYVTKPVIVKVSEAAPEDSQAVIVKVPDDAPEASQAVIAEVPKDTPEVSQAVVDSLTNKVQSGAKSPAKNKSHSSGPKPASLLPSDVALPGVNEASRSTESNQAQLSEKEVQLTDPRLLLGGGDGSGLEATNARVQHILSANNGAGELSKIVLDVPVLYQTRTMRWTPSDVAEARSLLNRLVVYESQLAKLRKDGLHLMAEWNRLLHATVPIPSLRADSPSLPHNQTLTSPPDKTGGGLPHAAVSVETNP